MAKRLPIPRGEALLVAVAASLAAAHALALRGRSLVPVGFDIPLWTDAALRFRHGLAPPAPPVYPAASVLIDSASILVGGLAVSLLAAALLPAAAYALARELGAGPLARVASALAVALSPDLAAHGAFFGPDALAALVYAAWFAALLGAAPGWWLFLTTALAVGVREPGLPLALVVATVALVQPTWFGLSRPRAALVLAGVAGSMLLAGRWPASLAEAFPSIHKFAPLAADLGGRGDGGYLLDVTAAIPGPLGGLEDAVRAAYAARVPDLGTLGRVAFNVLHAVVAHIDQLCLAALGAGGHWRGARAEGRPERGRLACVLFLPLLGTLLAWSQRRHFLPWLALSWAGVAVGIESLVLSRPRLTRRLAVAVFSLALWPALVISPRARAWMQAREVADAAVHALGGEIERATRRDDLLVFPLGRGLIDPVLLASAERPVVSLDQRLRGALRWRSVLLLPATEPAPPGWVSFAEAAGRRAYRYRSDVLDRECLRGELVGPLSFGLVPGDNGRGTRVVVRACGGSEGE